YIVKYVSVLLGTFKVIVFYFLFSYLFQYLLFFVLKIDTSFFYLQVDWWRTIITMLNFFIGTFSLIALMIAFHFNISKTNLVTTITLISFVAFMIAQGYDVNIPSWIPIVQLDKLQAGRSEIGEWITYYARLSFVQSIFILIIGYGFYHYKYHKR